MTLNPSTPSRSELWSMLLAMNGDAKEAGIHLHALSWFTKNGHMRRGVYEVDKLSDARLSIVWKKAVREYGSWLAAGSPAEWGTSARPEPKLQTREEC